MQPISAVTWTSLVLHVVGALLLVLGAQRAHAAEPGELIVVDTSASTHGILRQRSLTLSIETGCPSCEVVTSPNRIQLSAHRDLVGVNEVAGFMSRDFSLSASAFGTPSHVDALIRFDLRLNGEFDAIGQKASAEVRVIAKVVDLSAGQVIVTALAGSQATQGGGETVDLSIPGTPVAVGVPIPLPKLGTVANVPIHHFVTTSLQRGHTYRLTVEFEGAAQQIFAPLTGIHQNATLHFTGDNPNPVAAGGVPGGLHWDQAVVMLQHDRFELLETLADALLTHDTNVEARLIALQHQLDTVQHLLLLPAPKRPRFPMAARPDLLKKVIQDHCSAPGSDPDACAVAEFCADFTELESCNSADHLDDEGGRPLDCKWRRQSCVPR